VRETNLGEISVMA
jgi:hypothetical protein